MRATIYTYPWDLTDEGIDSAFDTIYFQPSAAFYDQSPIALTGFGVSSAARRK